MSREGLQILTSGAGFPRVSGDEPALSFAVASSIPFSPRERG